jgi:hypothetical protein
MPKLKRHIKLETRLINGQATEVWTDDGKDILDAKTGGKLVLHIKADQEGNIRLFDASEEGNTKPALVIPVNGPFHEDGRPQLVPDAMLNETVDAFADKLPLWQELLPEQRCQGPVHRPNGPPCFIEAPPGVPFRKSRPNKPDDFREARTKDYGDGTEMHEYNGRYNGSPFMAHEITTYNGLVLTRYIEYDQPQLIDFVDPSGVVTELNDVLIVDSEFQYEDATYMTTVITNSNNTYYFGDEGLILE